MIPSVTKLAILPVGFVFLLLSGCGSSKQTAASTATVIVYQENFDQGTVQVSWSGQSEAQSLAFQEDTGPLRLQAGAGTMEITGSNVSFNDIPLTLTPNTTNEFIMFGFEPYEQAYMLLTADTTPAAGSGAKLRIENCTVESTAGNLYLLPSGSVPNANSTSLSNYICNLNPVGGGVYQVLSLGTYDFFVTGSGPTQVLYKTTVTLAANQNRTLVLLFGCTGAGECPTAFATLLLDDLN